MVLICDFPFIFHIAALFKTLQHTKLAYKLFCITVIFSLLINHMCCIIKDLQKIRVMPPFG